MKAVLFKAIATEEDGVMSGELEAEAEVIVQFQGIVTELLTDEGQYWFRKLNIISQPTEVLPRKELQSIETNGYCFYAQDTTISDHWIAVHTIQELRALCAIVAAMKFYVFMAVEGDSVSDQQVLEINGVRAELIKDESENFHFIRISEDVESESGGDSGIADV